MKKILTVVICFLYFNSNAQQLHFKTDGYYIADNDNDTVFLIRTASLKSDMISEMKNQGLDVSNTTNGIPKGTIPLSGGSDIELMAFFSDTLGARDETLIWNKNEYQESIAFFTKARRGREESIVAATHTLHVHLNKNNTFYITTGTNGHNGKTFTGTLYKDHFIASMGYPTRDGFSLPRKKARIYKFYPFGQLPPKRDKLIFIYKTSLY